MFERAASHGIPEAAVRAIVERLGGEGVDPEDLVDWLKGWVEAAQRELGRSGNEGVAFELARAEVERRFRAGQMVGVSDPFMELFERERSESRKRQIFLIEEATDPCRCRR